jgi:cytochrome c551/c552
MQQRTAGHAGAVVSIDPHGIVVKLLVLTFAAGLSAAGAAQAEDPQALLQRHDCTLCHADDEAKTGPAFVDVAAKYHGKANAVSTLTAVVRNGSHGGGPWPMPPSPQVSAADARTMVQYILALRK